MDHSSALPQGAGRAASGPARRRPTLSELSPLEGWNGVRRRRRSVGSREPICVRTEGSRWQAWW